MTRISDNSLLIHEIEKILKLLKTETDPEVLLFLAGVLGKHLKDSSGAVEVNDPLFRELVEVGPLQHVAATVLRQPGGEEHLAAIQKYFKLLATKEDFQDLLKEFVRRRQRESEFDNLWRTCDRENYQAALEVESFVKYVDAIEGTPRKISFLTLLLPKFDVRVALRAGTAEIIFALAHCLNDRQSVEIWKQFLALSELPRDFLDLKPVRIAFSEFFNDFFKSLSRFGDFWVASQPFTEIAFDEALRLLNLVLNSSASQETKNYFLDSIFENSVLSSDLLSSIKCFLINLQ